MPLGPTNERRLLVFLVNWIPALTEIGEIKIVRRFGIEWFPAYPVSHKPCWGCTTVAPLWHNNQFIVQHFDLKGINEHESSLDSDKRLFCYVRGLFGSISGSPRFGYGALHVAGLLGGIAPQTNRRHEQTNSGYSQNGCESCQPKRIICKRLLIVLLPFTFLAG